MELLIIRYVVLVIFLVRPSTCGFDKHKLSLMIKDFLVTQNAYAKVHLALCWTNDEIINLQKVLSKQEIYSSVLTVRSEFSNLAGNQIFRFFVVDLNCNESITILNQAQTYKLIARPHTWFLLSNNQSAPESVVDLNIYLDSHFFIAYGEADTYHVTAIYKHFYNNTEFVENNVGLWRDTIGFDYFNRLNNIQNRSDLFGSPLIVSHVLTDLDSLNHLMDYKDIHIDGITKINYGLFHHISDIFNSRPEFILQDTWGYKNATSSHYNGMMGNLERGEAECAGTPSFLTKDRLDIIDYLAPTTPTNTRFMFRAPPLSYVTNIFTLTFSRDVWIASFIMLVVTAVGLYIAVAWEWRNPEYVTATSYRDETRLKDDVVDVMMVQIGALCQQGSDTEPRSSAGRIVFIFVFVAVLFLYTSFSANIVALLQSTSDSISTLEDLLQSRIKLGLEDTPYNRFYFSIETEPVRKAIYEKKIVPKGQKDNFMSLNEGIAKLQHEFFAFHCVISSAYKVMSDTFMENEKCGLKEIKYLQMVDPWLVIRKDSMYKELLKASFKRLHESGILSREIRRYFPKKPECQSGGSNFISVGLVDVYHAFSFFGTGALLAFLLMFIEIVAKKSAEKKVKKRLQKMVWLN